MCSASKFEESEADIGRPEIRAGLFILAGVVLSGIAVAGFSIAWSWILA